ncbi:MAG: Gfo/Idh/MocA family oxidoreductase [Coriobacteriia bacterium]|nr:Gfo/Idh/MocA family oxidoreductase [Coriobacteriia bacterium]
MSADKVRVAVVGAGRTGAPLIEAFLQLPYVEVVGIADKNPECRGAQIARERGVFFTEYPDVLTAKGSEIDVIIEVTGDPSVKPALKRAFALQGNTTTIIVHDLVARLILSLATGADHLVETYHPHDRGIGPVAQG